MSSLTSNTYRWYKLGTEAMFTWLSDALANTGIILDTRLEDTSIRNLLSLASQAKRAGASMPYEVLHSLEDALKIRRQYHAWYSNQISQDSSEEANKGIKQSNDSHQAFIDVLQYIHDLFAPAAIPSAHSTSSGASDEKTAELTNLFANLETEDIAEMEDDDQAVNTINQSSDPPPAVRHWVSKKAQALTEDKFLELYCLFDDANKIREYLRQKWAEYHSRKIDIISAAITTQEAFELFAEIEESYDLKYGISERRQGVSLPRFFDLFNHLSDKYKEDRTRTEKSTEYTTKSGKAAAKLQVESPGEEHEPGAEASGWAPSDELEDWVFKPANYAVLSMYAQPDDWILKQACRTTAERSRDLDAVLNGLGLDCDLRTAARGLLDTFLDIYAGMVFLGKNPTAFVTPKDIATTMWTKNYDLSIRKILTMHVLYDIRTAESEARQVDIPTQVSEDYKKLGGDANLFSRYLYGDIQQLPEDFKFLRGMVDKEQSWLKGRIPGHVDLPNRQRKKGLKKLSELPLQTNPVLAGMVLFHLSYNCYLDRVSSVNSKWFLVPLAHIMNWLTVAYGEATADFQKIWPDLHAALGMIGPRPVWKGSGPPEDLRTCRNRMLLLWGLPLKDFYQRMATGDIPKAEELFTRIKNNETAGMMVAEQGRGVMLRGKDHSNGPGRRVNPLLRIEANQSMPLLDAVRENLYSHGSMKAQQSHIRKIVLASNAVEGSADTKKGSPSKQKRRQEVDMLTYIDAFSRVAQAEIPRLMFPLDDVSEECCGIAGMVFGGVIDKVILPLDMWKCAAMSPFRPDTNDDERRAWVREQKFGDGAQSMCSLLALITMFGDRAGGWGNVRLERLMLDLLEKERKIKSGYLNDRATKGFVEKCKEFGFAVPECATEASASSPAGPST
ncbi:hypothetical protein INS49_009803 [Diaporthe citri]|uniref:uncharacterized protein n=1 Tax=Diaporthe citri TaxID=83186 RepID=UPI001C8024C3|nr:uncharacterized protein INS49_009803 [Diaporthe citri]KAG6361576.1 hypothetical protein INS49_009803 [Diaporthe citri]